MAGINQVITPAQAHKLKNICDVAVPLLSTDWQGTAAPYTIQVDWPGMTDRDMPEVWLVPAGDTPSNAELAAARLITPSTENGHMLFSASSKPSTSITARVTGVPISGEFTAANMASLVSKVDHINTGLAGQLKMATISGTIAAVSSNKYVGGYGAEAPISGFTGYPTDLNEIIGYLPITTYYSDKVGIAMRGSNSIALHAPAAGSYTVRGILLYR